MGHEYNEIKCFLSRAPLIHHGALITPLPPPQQGFCPTHFCACHFVSCMVFAQKLMQLVFAKRLLYFYSTKSTISNSRPLTKTKQNKTKVRIPTINISTLNNTNAIFFTNHKSKVKPVKTCNKTTAGLSIFDQQMCQTELIGGVFLAPSMSSW
jgi:hypothetical protein